MFIMIKITISTKFLLYFSHFIDKKSLLIFFFFNNTSFYIFEQFNNLEIKKWERVI